MAAVIDGVAHTAWLYALSETISRKHGLGIADIADPVNSSSTYI